MDSMKLSPKTSIHDLIEAFPFLVDFLASYNPKYGLLRNKVMRATLGRMATLEKVASIGEVELGTLMDAICGEVQRRTGERPEADLSGGGGATGDMDGERGKAPNTRVTVDDAKVGEMKRIISALHDGEPLEDARKRFLALAKDVAPAEIAAMEERLIREGMPVDEVQRLCDVHVGVFRDMLDRDDVVAAPPGHPVHTYMADNEIIGGLAARLGELVGRLGETGGRGGGMAGHEPGLRGVLAQLASIENHYVRKENQLFPALERHGVSGPSQVMWGVHDEIRATLKGLARAIDERDAGAVAEKGAGAARAISEMVYKENKILFPLALDKLASEEWAAMRRGEDELGYGFARPAAPWPPDAEGAGATGRSGGGGRQGGEEGDGQLRMRTGALTLEQINLMLTHLPVDISFVDAEGHVRYYSDTNDRIFPRSPGVIGRHVEMCHPPKSVDTVREIVESFRSGREDVAEFWIQMQGRFLHIRYFAVRDGEGRYAGTLEVSQDVTGIRALEGENRLLDWGHEHGGGR